MRQPIEVAIELTAQELLAPTGDGFVEIDDVGAMIAPPSTTAELPPAALETTDAIEIELTPEQMDELLR